MQLNVKKNTISLAAVIMPWTLTLVVSFLFQKIHSVYKHHMPLRNSKDCIVFLCCYISLCQCRESLFNNAKSVD